MEKSKENKTFKDFSKYFIVVAFLCLEVAAFLSFSLGGSILVYGILGIVLMVLLILVTFKEIKFDGVIRIAYFIFPILLFSLLTVVSSYSIYYYRSNMISLTSLIFLPLSMTVFAFVGYFLSLNKGFKISTLMTVIYSALALYVFINFIATMVQFGPFYTIIYGNYHIYYDGQVSPTLNKLAYGLIGFEICEVSIAFYSFFPSILLSSAIGLLFIKPKENIRLFLAYVGFSLLGFLALLFTLNKRILVTDILLLIVFVLIVIFVKKPTLKVKKVYKVSFIVIAILCSLFLFICFLNAQKDWSFLSGLQNLITKNSLFNRVFNSNEISNNINKYFYNLFTIGTNGKFFGFFVPDPVHMTSELTTSSGLFFIDNLATSGVVGSLSLCIFLFIVIKLMKKFINDERFIKKDRFFILSLISFFFVYISLNNSMEVTIFKKYRSNYYYQGIFLLIIMLIFYCYSFYEKKEEKNIKIEEGSENKNEKN